jgi:hypothetical protein
MPSAISEPQISQETVLPPAAVAKFTATNAAANSSIVVEALELRIQGQWKGEIKISDTAREIVSAISIKDKDVNGWFVIDVVPYFLQGHLNTLSRNATFALYSGGGTKFSDIRGSLQLQSGQYILTGQSSDISFQLRTDTSAVSEITVNDVISGPYLGYYEKGPSSFELHAELCVTKDGIVSGRGHEENRQFSMFGMIDEERNRFFFVRLKGNDITYYNGEAQLQGEIFFLGRWQMQTQSGGFTLIKCMAM